MLCGVCGGIGEYLNIDPTLVRLLAVLLGCSGTGILVLHHSGHHYSGQSGIEHKIRIILTERDSLQKAVPVLYVFRLSWQYSRKSRKKA